MKRRTPLLPAYTTPFIGRERDLGRLRELYGRGARLVTVLGPPGMGKSRLAQRFAELVRDAYAAEGGTFFADLTDARTSDDVAQALLSARPLALNVEGLHGEPAERVGRALSTVGRALVILDNCESAPRAVAEAVSRWLALAPELRFLLTSRERLGLSAEFIHELGPLRLPEDASEAADSEAVQLFVDRARAVRSDFALTRTNADALARVVRELDGIPLALELAATRMGVLSAAALLERLPRRFELLAQTHRDVSGRQRTLKAAIDSSFETLDAAQRSVLAQASLFRGGFSLEAAEAVLKPRGRKAPPIVDVLQALRDRSLLHTYRPAQIPEEVRFGLYLAIRDYARAWLDAKDPACGVAERHAHWFLAFAERTAKAIRSGKDPLATRRMLLELENLRAVHRRLLDRRGVNARRAAQSVLLCEALEPLLGGTGAATLETMVDASLASGKLDARTKAVALRLRAEARRSLGRLDAAAADARDSVALARRVRDPKTRGGALTTLAVTLQLLGEVRESGAALDEAIPLLARAREPALEVRALTMQAQLCIIQGYLEDAQSSAERAVKLAERIDDRTIRLQAHGTRGAVHLALGRLREARADIEPGYRAFQSEQNAYLEANFSIFMGLLALDEGRPDEAVDVLRRGVEVARRAASQRNEGMAQGLLGNALHEQGRLPEALARYEDAVRLLAEVGDRRAEALYSASASAAHSLRGNVTDAEALVRRARHLVRELEPDDVLRTAIDVHAAHLELARAHLTDEPAERARLRAKAAEIARLARERQVRGLSVASVSMHVRTALRILSRQLEEPASRAVANAGATPSRADHALLLSRDGRRLSLPDGRDIVFQRAKSLRLMLLRLFEERLEHPGRALPVSALFEAGWPGERVSEEAAENRVYVGISRLRKQGLHALLVSRDDGFLIDPEVPARWRHGFASP